MMRFNPLDNAVDLECPHCHFAVHAKLERHVIHETTAATEDEMGDAFRYSQTHIVVGTTCLRCKQVITYYVLHAPSHDKVVTTMRLIWPRHASRRIIPPEVPEAYSTEFSLAEELLPISPEASAAYSRRLLQTIIRQEAKIDKGNLHAEIKEFVTQRRFTSGLSEHLRSLKDIGNFGAHPNKNTNTNEIIPVDPGEAEWCLDVLFDLFDELSAKPKVAEERMRRLEEKKNPQPAETVESDSFGEDVPF